MAFVSNRQGVCLGCLLSLVWFGPRGLKNNDLEGSDGCLGMVKLLGSAANGCRFPLPRFATKKHLPADSSRDLLIPDRLR